jgi:hypothetical protein
LTGSARPIRTAPGRGRAAALHVTDRGAALRADGQQVISAADETLLAALPADQRVVGTFSPGENASSHPDGGDCDPHA